MNHTITLPQNLVDEIDAMKKDLGFLDIEAAAKHLLKNAIDRERKLRIARLYQNRQKTMRQCAEMLNVDLEEMMDILIELGIPFGQDDLEDQLKSVEKIVKQMQPTSQA